LTAYPAAAAEPVEQTRTQPCRVLRAGRLTGFNLGRDGLVFFMAHFRSRLPASLYVAGPFAMGYTEFYNFLIPLYGLSLGMSAGQIGMLVGARSLLAVFLSIHVGVLMDRLGTRRVALFFVWTAMAMAPVFPLLPWFWPLLLLQMVNGGALQFAWSGSQTLIAQLAEGEAEYLGRFSFFARIGTTVAPMIAGVAWDFGGAWPAMRSAVPGVGR